MKGKKMRIAKYALAVTLLSTALLTSSCEKWLDINDNPNQSIKTEPKLLYNYAVTSWVANRTGGDSYIPFGLAAQSIASGGNYGWGKADVYDISPYSLGNTWKAYYSTAGNNLKLAITQAEAAIPANNNSAAQCKIILAQMMYEATMIWGDIPFAESWRTDVAFPKFDSQKEVMESIIALIDEAVAQIDPASPLKIGDYDLVYKGDMNKWIRFAKSVKFRTLMTMVDKDPSKAAAIGTMLTSGGMIASASDNFSFPFYNQPDKENPKFRLLQKYSGGTNTFFFANKNVLDYMAPTNDPRISKYFDKPVDQANYLSVQTEEEASDATAKISMYLYRADAPEVVFSLQEQLYFEAEAYARGLGVAKDLAKANELYKKATEEALKFNGISAVDASTYASTKLPNLTTSVKPLDDIHIAQWIDLMDRPLDAFTQWRRSGPEGSEVPDLNLPDGAPNGPLMRRWLYSPDEETANPNTPKGTKYTDKLWFDL